MQLSHIRLLVDNYKECFLFYRDVLGFDVSWGDEDSNYADFKFSGVTLGLFDRKQMVEAIGEEYVAQFELVDRTALIFQVPNVEEAYQTMKNKVEFYNGAY